MKKLSDRLNDLTQEAVDKPLKNGVMNPDLLYEPPFTDIHEEGLDGVFDEDDADSLVSLVRSFNETVGAPFRTVA